MKHIKLFESFKQINESVEAISAEQAKEYFDQSKWTLHPSNDPETYIIMKAGEKYSMSAPKEGVLYTPKNSAYGKWAESIKGKGAYAIGK